MKKLFLLLLLLSLAAPSYATTFYVSTTGSNSNSCGASQTITTPKLTIQNFMDNCTLAPGDTLYIRGGVYVERVLKYGITGSSGNYITISEYPNETVVIRPATGTGPAFNLRESSWVHVVGIHTDCIHNVGSGCLDINIGGPNTYDGMWIDGVIVSDNGREGLNVNCDNTLAFAMPDSEGWYESGMHFGTGGPNTKLTNSEFYGNGAHGVYTSGDLGFLIDGINTHGNCLKGAQKYPGGKNFIIRNSIFHDNPHDDGLGIYNSGPGGNNLVYNNLMYNNGCGAHPNGGSGIALRYGEESDQIYFNTIYGNCAYGIDDSFYNSDFSGSTIKNNIVYGNNVNIGSGSPSVLSNNLTTDPNFLNAAIGDFHLLDTSSALGAGVTISGITVDKDGVTRPNPPSIGAFETPSGSNPTDPLDEDFDAYTVGFSIDTLNGGSGWTQGWELIDGVLTIETAPAWMSGKSLRQNTTAFSEARRFFTAHSGSFSIFFNMSLSATPNDYIVVSAMSTGGGFICRVAFDPNGDLLAPGGTLDAGITPDHSYAIEMNFDTSAQVNKCRARADGGTFTAWTAVDPFSSIAGIAVSSYATNVHTFWLDNLSDEAGVGGSGTITVGAPITGQVCTSGSTCAISWASNGLTGALTGLYYLVNGNDTPHLIASPDVSATPYTWTVNAPAGTTIKIRATQGAVTDDGDEFTVRGTKTYFK